MSDKNNNQSVTLPTSAQLTINHCNLPAAIIGGLSYNEFPVPLFIDGVHALHKNLFIFLDKIKTFEERRTLFYNYMQTHFQLDDLTQMGQNNSARLNRVRIDYKRLILGWHMNPNGHEGAVLKRWVESRIGLTPRFHQKPIRSFNDPSYGNYLQISAKGIYNTNAIEAQLDVLYSYAQYELHLLSNTYIVLYRGLNNLRKHEILNKHGKQLTFLLNNVNSFSKSAEIAQHFGDYVVKINVPIYKIFCYNKVLPKQINSEDEFIVIGGIYKACLI